MAPLTLPQRYESLLRTALEVACDRFEDNARQLKTGDERNPRLADQFEAQAKDCRTIIQIIDDGSACDDGRAHDWAEPTDERRPTVCRRCNTAQ